MHVKYKFSQRIPANMPLNFRVNKHIAHCRHIEVYTVISGIVLVYMMLFHQTRVAGQQLLFALWLFGMPLMWVDAGYLMTSGHLHNFWNGSLEMWESCFFHSLIKIKRINQRFWSLFCKGICLANQRHFIPLEGPVHIQWWANEKPKEGHKMI